MAYTLKTSGLALNLTHCFVVDGGVLVDKKGAATISGTSGCSFGSAQWRSATSNSSSHEYIATNGTSGYITFGTKPSFKFAGLNSTFVAFGGNGVNLTAGASSAGYFFNGSGVVFGCSSWNPFAYTEGYTSRGVVGSSPANLADIYNQTTGQFGLCASMNGATSATLYFDSDGGAMTDKTGATYLSASAGTFQPTYWGVNGSATQPITHRLFCIATFDKALSAAEAQSLNEDWFGTLFEASGASVAPIVMKWKL